MMHFSCLRPFLILSALAPAWLWTPTVMAAPQITEVVADNDGQVVDEDGEASDWLELHNPDALPADLSGWHLTDNAGNLGKWTFPAGVTLAPGEFRVVWASSKNRTTDPTRLHTNFSLSAGGEYLALVVPDGSSRPSEFSPGFPSLETGESFGALFTTTSLIGAGTPAQFRVPTDGALGSTWTAPGFVAGDGWSSGPTNLGFGMPVPGFFIEERQSTAAITSLTTAELVLGGTNASDLLTAVVPLVNFTGENGGDGRFGDGTPMLHGGDNSNIAMRATATVVIPTGGTWTFHVNSDEGFRLRLDGTAILTVGGLRTPADSLISRQVTAGNHTLVLTYFENIGGEEVELSAASGTHTAFSNAFRLIGDTTNGGLAVLAPTNTGQSAVATDLGPVMQNINSSVFVRLPFTVADPAALGTLDLSIGYNDGFIAFLNGTEVARREAPAAASFNAASTGIRPVIDSLRPETIGLSTNRSLLSAGQNVLALHGLNTSAADSTFYLAPNLRTGRSESGETRYYRAPTPAAPNTSIGVLGHVADTSFSHDRGFYTEPFALTLTSDTAGAIIRYTLDGSTPTALNATVYTAPIPIDKTTVVRAMAVRDEYEPTNVDTQTYVFLDDVILQGGPTAPYHAKPGPTWPNHGSVAGQLIDFGMDRTIVNHTNATLGGQPQVKAALRAIPSIFLSTDVANLFHATTGIYTHAGSYGRTWERPAAIEMTGDAGTPEGGFHAACGIRIRGGYSRSASNPKHSFRVFFRRDYGPGNLDYPVFGGAGANEFDGFDLQCSQNYSWSFEGDPNHNALREIWSRDTHAALGHQATRGRFVHLYLNGVYWGLYQIQERAEAAFGATYLGGEKENFDVIKHTGSPGGYTTEATDGDFLRRPDGSLSAWKKLWNATRASYFTQLDKNPVSPYQSLSSTAEQKRSAYFKIMGLQADGQTPTGEAPLLDVDNLIDYMLVVLLSKNADSPLTSGGGSPNNFYAMRDRTGIRGFISLQHDAEHSLNAGGANDRWGPFENATTGNWNRDNYSNPQFFHQDLSPSTEYRMRFADHMYRHFFNNGALTATRNQARLDARAGEIEPAIIAESARWGDSKTTPARNISHWRAARTATRNWFSSRSTQLVNEARTRGFYPTIDPPTFNQRGGAVAPGFNVVLTNPNITGGTVYYTTDGSDPRPVGGGFVSTTLVPESTTVDYLVPSTTNGGSALVVADWTTRTAPPNDADWASGRPMGLGFNPANRPATTNFTPFIQTNLQSEMQPTGGTANGTVYIRMPFTVSASQLEEIDNLRLRLRYDDGFVAYLNGTEISRKVVAAAVVPTWNSVSGGSHADTAAIAQEAIPVPNFASLLVPGENMLAFHVMNQSATQNDLLFSAEVEYDTFGGAAGSAYTAPIALASGTTIRTRTLQGSVWSALNEATFFTDTVPASAENLVVSEFSYNPASAQNGGEEPFAASDFEFIELQNISGANVDLYNVVLGGGANLILSTTIQQRVLQPGGRIVVAANPAALAQRYGAIGPVIGPYDGSMDNSNESIRLTAADGSTIKDFSYHDSQPWPEAADGEGFSLVLINPPSNPDHSNPNNWRSSAGKGGHPGQLKSTTYATWKTAEGIASDEADSDADGLNAFAEYALGTPPNLPSFPSQPSVATATFLVNQVSGEYFTFSYRRRLAADDVFIIPEGSQTLGAALWLPHDAVIVSETNHGDGTATLLYRSALPIDASRPLFLRLKITPR